MAAQLEEALGKNYPMSDKAESDWGRKIWPIILKKMGARVRSTGADAEYIRAVGKRVARFSSRPGITYRFHYLKGVKTPNAFAGPGGYIGVTEGFMKSFSKNEAQLGG
jgi:predicted Zn-dependent protease